MPENINIDKLQTLLNLQIDQLKDLKSVLDDWMTYQQQCLDEHQKLVDGAKARLEPGKARLERPV